MKVSAVGEEYDGGGLYGFAGIGMELLKSRFCVGWGLSLWTGDDKSAAKVIQKINLTMYFNYLLINFLLKYVKTSFAVVIIYLNDFL